MPDDEPKWRRRKAARPSEIVDAALEVFAEKGFAAAKLDDIAHRAGVSKATLYLYFDTKKEIFRAVAQSAVASLLEALESQSEGTDAPFAELAPKLLLRAAAMMKGGRVPAIARMVIGESRTFPDLARIWHDDVVASVIGIVTGMIARAQARGEVTPGDPRLHAFSLMGPMVMAMLFRIAETHAPDATYDEVRRHFEDKELADLTTLIGLINLWNRLAIGFRYQHPVE